MKLRSFSVFLQLALLLVASASLFSDEVAKTDSFNNEPELGCAGFGHCWQSGDQNYELSESLLSTAVISNEDFRKLVQSQSASANAPPEPRPDESIRLVGYQQEDSAPVVDKQEPESDDKTANERQVIDSTYRGKDINALRNVINGHREAISSDTRIGDAVKSSRLQILTSANEALLQLNESESKRIAYQNEIEQMEATKGEIRHELEQVIEPGRPTVNEATRLENLTNELKDRQGRLEQKKTELKALESEIKHHSQRVSEIPGDRAKANERLQQIREEIAEFQSDDLDSQLGLLLQDSKRRAVEAELKKLDVEVRRQELGAKIDPIKRDVISREINRLEVEIKRWEVAARKLRDAEVREEQQLASEAAETAHFSLRPLAERNAALIEEQKTTVAKLEKLKKELAVVNLETESIVKRRTEIERKIEAAGLTGTNGMLLVELRRNLMTTGESHIRIRQLQKDLRAVNLKKVGLNEERDELADPLGTVEQLVRSSDPDDPLLKKALQFVETKRDYLDQLIDDCQSYGRQISEVSEARKKLIDELNQTVAYIDENALWVRSADPVHLSNFKSAGVGLAEFFASQKWSDVSARMRHRMSRRPYESALAIFSMFLLFAVNRRIKQKLESNNQIDESST